MFLDPFNLPDGFTGVNYSRTLKYSGNTGAVTFAVAQGSTLPAGLNLVSGVLTGSPTSAGNNQGFNLTATDDKGTVFRNFNVNIYGVSIAGSSALGNVAIGSAMTPITLVGQGGTGPYSFVNTTGMPPGLSLSPVARSPAPQPVSPPVTTSMSR